MKYRTIPDEETKTYTVVNKGTFGVETKCDPNLFNHELKVVVLMAENCPMENNRKCITIDHGISRICMHLNICDWPGLIAQDRQKSHAYIACGKLEEMEKQKA